MLMSTVWNKESPIYIAGHRGMVGSALVRNLESSGFGNLLCKTRDELDLTDPIAVSDFFSHQKPEYVILAAAKVGGIIANNSFPADFILENSMIQNNVIHSAFKSGVKRLLFLGSSCIYPKKCEQPIKEEYFLTGELEPTNRPYAIAKISGVETCWAFNRQYGTQYLSVMPTNLYGPGDNYHPENSHVIPGLIRKFHEAKVRQENEVIVWGSGRPLREFLHVDDMANACTHLLNLDDDKYNSLLSSERNDGIPPIVNVGTGKDISIGKLAEIIAEIIGFEGEVKFDTSKPDGTMKKLLDTSRLNSLGYTASIDLYEGLTTTYKHFLSETIREK